MIRALVILAALSGSGSGLTALNVPLEGHVVAQKPFEDKDGEHLLVVTETDVELHGPKRSKKLFGYQFDKKNGRWVEAWRTQDFVNDCEFDLTLHAFPDSLAATDLDGDGHDETRFTYELGCRSDVSPLTVKVLVHEAGEKFALRGHTLEFVGPDENGTAQYAGGDFTLDPAFDKAPESFKAAAKQDFEKFKKGVTVQHK